MYLLKLCSKSHSKRDTLPYSPTWTMTIHLLYDPSLSPPSPVPSAPLPSPHLLLYHHFCYSSDLYLVDTRTQNGMPRQISSSFSSWKHCIRYWRRNHSETSWIAVSEWKGENISEDQGCYSLFFLLFSFLLVWLVCWVLFRFISNLILSCRDHNKTWRG